jgi:hypothetical protein
MVTMSIIILLILLALLTLLRDPSQTCLISLVPAMATDPLKSILSCKILLIDHLDGFAKFPNVSSDWHNV